MIVNWINGEDVGGRLGEYLEKHDPNTGDVQSWVLNSSNADVDVAVRAAQEAYLSWSEKTPVERGSILTKIAIRMEEEASELAEIVALETGKPIQDAEGEVSGAVLQGHFFGGEGLRMFGRTLNSSVYGKRTFTVREPYGPAALIVPANTPIANLAWKVFPALVCGNTAIVKASEDAPQTAIFFARLCSAAGLPDGVLNVIHGYGEQCGNYLVNHENIKVISFTGSTAVGKKIAVSVAPRLVPLSLELGGKNPFIVCADANLDNAVHWAILSCFSNAGQRCSAASRVLVHDSIEEEFLEKFLVRTKKLHLGTERNCDLGPVLTAKHHANIRRMLEEAIVRGAEILCGNNFTPLPEAINGYYIAPTLVRGIEQTDPINRQELFAPVASLQTFTDPREALSISNDSVYGLTSAVHTENIGLASWFTKHLKHGVVNINIGTFGSEPQFPFGGYGQSGNGTREPGTEALDVYSQTKVISFSAMADL